MLQLNKSAICRETRPASSGTASASPSCCCRDESSWVTISSTWWPISEHRRFWHPGREEGTKGKSKKETKLLSYTQQLLGAPSCILFLLRDILRLMNLLCAFKRRTLTPTWSCVSEGRSFSRPLSWRRWEPDWRKSENLWSSWRDSEN